MEEQLLIIYPLFGFEDEGYGIDVTGNIWSRKNSKHGLQNTWRKLKCGMRNGYKSLTLMKNNIQKKYYIHLLLYKQFIGDVPNGMLVRHLNDNKLDNRLQNLLIGSYQDNANDAAKNGRRARGEAKANSKLNESDIRKIRNEYSDGMSQNVLANKYNVSCSLISRIVNKIIWTHVEDAA